MSVDLAPEVVAALRSPQGRAALADAIVPLLAAEIRAALAERADILEPLHEIIGGTRKGSWSRAQRDDGLRALGVPVSRRLMFRRSEVLAYLKQRAAGAR